MKICFLSGTAAWGGAEVHTARLANLLADRGHEVSVVALGHDVFSKRASGAGVRFAVQTLPLPRPAAQLGWREWAGLLRRVNGDVCVLVRWGLEVGSLRMDLAARHRFGRYIAIEHSSAELPPRVSRRHCGGLLPGVGLWWYRQFALWHLRSAVSSLVVCVSDTARHRLVRQFRVPPDKVLTIHNGIDTHLFRPSGAYRAAQRRAWGVPASAFVFGAVGRLSAEKGYDLAIESFARLALRRPDRELWLVLVGEGRERGSLQEAARAAGLKERVLFPGFSDRPWEVCAALDVFLLPSREEAMPLALLEAMASGCCPVAMAVGGVGEVISTPDLGWLVPAGNHNRFLAAMEAASQMSPPARAATSAAVRHHVVAHFDAQQQDEKLARLIEAS